MLTYKLWTKEFKHQYSFHFKGKEYLVHSIVRLTDEGKRYLGSRTHEVILTEQFINRKNRYCWTYTFKSIEVSGHIVHASTDRTPDDLIDKVVMPATTGYTSRAVLCVDSTEYKTGQKHTKKDWEIPEVAIGWIILIAVFIGSSIFKDLYVRLIVRIAASWFFALYRKAHVDAYTTYTHDEDIEILNRKQEILYGTKNNKENDINE